MNRSPFLIFAFTLSVPFAGYTHKVHASVLGRTAEVTKNAISHGTNYIKSCTKADIAGIVAGLAATAMYWTIIINFEKKNKNLAEELRKHEQAALYNEQAKAFQNGRLELAKKEVEELELIRMLARLPLVLDQVVESHRPSTLATYVIDVTKVFNSFYRAHKVLVEDTELARARLALVLATQRTLLKSLTLLGMRVPERM